MDKELKTTIVEITRAQSRDSFRRDQQLVPRDLMSLSALDAKLRNFKKEPVMEIEKMEGPNWKTAVRIYCAVLQNPDADPNAKINAEADLMKLADAMDKIREEKKS